MEVFMSSATDKLSLTDKGLDVLLETFMETLPERLEQTVQVWIKCKKEGRALL